jgi:hypothetical protein
MGDVVPDDYKDGLDSIPSIKEILGLVGEIALIIPSALRALVRPSRTK